MKNFSVFLLAILFSGSIFSQQTLSTSTAGWGLTNVIPCSAVPLTPGEIGALTFPNQAGQVCPGIVSPTGDALIGVPGNNNNACYRPNHETRVFRGLYQSNSSPCLVTYNFTADNAFRIYVNRISSPTNSNFGGTPPNQPDPGVCGSDYSGNDWRAAFAGTLNTIDFGTGNNAIDFEVQNGISTGNHPFWLSGNLLFWRESDLNSTFGYSIDYNPETGVVNVYYGLSPQANGALFTIKVEYTNSYPNNPLWIPFYTYTGTKKQLKLNPCPPIPNIPCDEDGAAVKVTLTARAGDCVTSTSYTTWLCERGFKQEENLVTEQSSGDSEYLDFKLTSDQIKEIHEEFNQKLAKENNQIYISDSLFEVSTKHADLQIFPNPSNGRIWVNMGSVQEELTPFKIFNQIGEQVFEGHIQNRQELDLSKLPNGIYYLKTFGTKSTNLGAIQFVLQR